MRNLNVENQWCGKKTRWKKHSQKQIHSQNKPWKTKTLIFDNPSISKKKSPESEYLGQTHKNSLNQTISTISPFQMWKLILPLHKNSTQNIKNNPLPPQNSSQTQKNGSLKKQNDTTLIQN